MNNVRIPWFIYPVVLSFAFAWLITGYISYTHTPVLKEGVKLAGGKSSASKKADITLINERNIFSLLVPVPQTNEDGTPVEASAPVASNVKLIGILFSERQRSYAFLNVNGEQILLTVGETAGGVTLETLEKTSVTVMTSTGRTKLELYSGDSKPSFMSAQTASSAQNTDEVESGDMSPTQRVSMTRSDFVTKVGDVNGIMKTVLMRPYEVDGKVVGYRLSRMTKDSVLRNLGLKNGDAVMRINGEVLKSPDVLFGILSSVEDISAVTIDVERSGSKKTIYVDID